ncbi:hypothetical protein FHR84_002356 [Actinopolyspora biskrensis]|uniref:Uncharacterized protein n=2 Tax=Actinopolyspora TaxID=1849 RepID=A0A1H1DMX4_9ACTN|nr:hypothetical protein [Actinopolyspora biskrensis]SDQ77881.1 hypothetical protein SAMN04489718_2156 [Actinopolyspora saharensis]
MAAKWICPECEEEAINTPPTKATPQLRAEGLPEWSHRDGEPLCPVMSSSGYVPADPVSQ